MANGRIANFMVRDNSSLKMAHIIWGHSLRGLLMEKEGIVITMVVYMKEKYRIIRPMDWGFIMTHFKDINTMVSGKMMCRMVRENRNFRMVHIMKANFFMA